MQVTTPPSKHRRTFISFLAATLWSCSLTLGASVDAVATYHSFSDSNVVSRVNPDGDLRYPFPLPSLGSFTQPNGLAIDPVAKKLYYCRVNSIWSINLDGTGNATVKDFGLNSAPLHLEIDVANGHLYMYFNGHTQGIARGIYRMNTDGTEVVAIITALGLATSEPPVDPLVSANGADGLVIDTLGRSLYWSDDRKLYRSGLTGTGAKLLATLPFNISGFEIDHANAKLYISNSTVIQRSDLDGTGSESVYSPGFGFPEALELDADRGRLYFIHNKLLKYTNLDGSLEPVEVIGVGNSRGKDIEIGPMPALTMPKIVSAGAVVVSNARKFRIRYTTDPGIRYSVESSTDMTAGSWAAAGTSVVGTGADVTVDYALSGKRKFYRVRRDDPCE